MPVGDDEEVSIHRSVPAAQAPQSSSPNAIQRYPPEYRRSFTLLLTSFVPRLGGNPREVCAPKSRTLLPPPSWATFNSTSSQPSLPTQRNGASTRQNGACQLYHARSRCTMLVLMDAFTRLCPVNTCPRGVQPVPSSKPNSSFPSSFTRSKLSTLEIFHPPISNDDDDSTLFHLFLHKESHASKAVYTYIYIFFFSSSSLSSRCHRSRDGQSPPWW